MLCLYLQAPFAACRTFATGSFRPTAGFLTHSAVYGLLLNVAGIEMRHDDGKSAMTRIKTGLPQVRLALGALSLPRVQSIYQQLHNYPVGNTSKERAPATKGTKYNIVPARRAFLSGVRAYVCVDAQDDFRRDVEKGLLGESKREYGLPFLGDNNFLLDRLEPVGERRPAHWFVRVGPDEEGLRDNVTRLTLTIDRLDMSRTKSGLFAPTPPQTEVPEAAWVEVGY